MIFKPGEMDIVIVGSNVATQVPSITQNPLPAKTVYIYLAIKSGPTITGIVFPLRVLIGGILLIDLASKSVNEKLVSR